LLHRLRKIDAPVQSKGPEAAASWQCSKKRAIALPYILENFRPKTHKLGLKIVQLGGKFQRKLIIFSNPNLLCPQSAAKLSVASHPGLSREGVRGISYLRPRNILGAHTIAQKYKVAIAKIRTGKAPGIDGVTAEHVLNCHPTISLHLLTLFNAIVKHNYVPAEFGFGVTIPLLKDDNVDRSNIDNYRAITISPVLS